MARRLLGYEGVAANAVIASQEFAMTPARLIQRNAENFMLGPKRRNQLGCREPPRAERDCRSFPTESRPCDPAELRQRRIIPGRTRRSAPNASRPKNLVPRTLLEQWSCSCGKPPHIRDRHARAAQGSKSSCWERKRRSRQHQLDAATILPCAASVGAALASTHVRSGTTRAS